MKVKTISRSEEAFTRSRSGDMYKTFRNLDPALHHFERAREYTRALNATKLERLFSKPFIDSMSGHIDGVYCMAKHPTRLNTILSGSADGEIKIWDLPTRQCLGTHRAHQGFVRGLCSVPNSNTFISVGDDKIIKIWSNPSEDATQTIITKSLFTGIDHHRSQKLYATSSSVIELWDHERTTPTQTLSWGAETITCLKMNQVETQMIASCGTDRTICLYDIRSDMPVSKVLLEMRSNSIAWNPMEAFHFTVANEDHNCYTFDMRNLKSAINVLKDHVSAVIDLDYSPTGQEIVTGSYDKTIRIFKVNEGHSRDVYHTKRMQKVFTVRFTMDGKKIISGSDDGNIRIWKTNAYEKLGNQTAKERDAYNYSKALKERYKHMPEIKRIDRQRYVPKAIYSASKIKRIQNESQKRKEKNIRQHSAPDQMKPKSERSKHILATE